MCIYIYIYIMIYIYIYIYASQDSSHGDSTAVSPTILSEQDLNYKHMNILPEV